MNLLTLFPIVKSSEVDANSVKAVWKEKPKISAGGKAINNKLKQDKSFRF